LHLAPALCLLLASPALAQGGGIDASAFARSEWLPLGEAADGATVSLSQDRYLDGTTLTFALRTEFAAGEERSNIEVIELDCAAERARRISATARRRNGEVTASNEPGEFAAYPPESLVGQLAVPLCERVTGAGAGGN
jgi:hypothetical protein